MNKFLTKTDIFTKLGLNKVGQPPDPGPSEPTPDGPEDPEAPPAGPNGTPADPLAPPPPEGTAGPLGLEPGGTAGPSPAGPEQINELKQALVELIGSDDSVKKAAAEDDPDNPYIGLSDEDANYLFYAQYGDLMKGPAIPGGEMPSGPTVDPMAELWTEIKEFSEGQSFPGEIIYLNGKLQRLSDAEKQQLFDYAVRIDGQSALNYLRDIEDIEILKERVLSELKELENRYRDKPIFNPPADNKTRELQGTGPETPTKDIMPGSGRVVDLEPTVVSRGPRLSRG